MTKQHGQNSTRRNSTASIQHDDKTARVKIECHETAKPQKTTAENGHAKIQHNVQTAQWRKGIHVAVPGHPSDQFLAVNLFIGGTKIHVPVQAAR